MRKLFAAFICMSVLLGVVCSTALASDEMPPEGAAALEETAAAAPAQEDVVDVAEADTPLVEIVVGGAEQRQFAADYTSTVLVACLLAIMAAVAVAVRMGRKADE